MLPKDAEYCVLHVGTLETKARGGSQPKTYVSNESEVMASKQNGMTVTAQVPRHRQLTALHN